MKHKRFRISRLSSSLLRRFVDAGTVCAISEDLEDRYQQMAEESGRYKARLKIRFHIYLLSHQYNQA